MLRSPRQKYLKQKNEQTVHLSAKRKDTSGVENWAQLEIRQLAITKFHDGTTAKMLLPLSASLLARFFLLPFFFSWMFLLTGSGLIRRFTVVRNRKSLFLFWRERGNQTGSGRINAVFSDRQTDAGLFSSL